MASSSNKATITKGLRLRLMDRETQAREKERMQEWWQEQATNLSSIYSPWIKSRKIQLTRLFKQTTRWQVNPEELHTIS